MDSDDELRKVQIAAAEQLGVLPRVLPELQELVPLASAA